ncbi:MAG: hypothetical protein J6B81_00305 [Spirochaetaceae bacterium]|nr:hypothetical protein [Spirochaetaceae bacterium]
MKNHKTNEIFFWIMFSIFGILPAVLLLIRDVATDTFFGGVFLPIHIMFSLIVVSATENKSKEKISPKRKLLFVKTKKTVRIFLWSTKINRNKKDKA